MQHIVVVHGDCLRFYNVKHENIKTELEMKKCTLDSYIRKNTVVFPDSGHFQPAN